MEHKEDIGSLIEKKLNSAAKSPDDALWNKINESLEEKRKRKAFIFWITSGSILFVAVLYLILTSTFINNSNTSTEITDTFDSKNNKEVTNSENTLGSKTVLKNDSIKFKTENIINNTKETTNNETNKQLTAKEKEQNIKRAVNLFDTIEENAVVKTTYYYSNSDSLNIKTTDKRIIDSLINVGNKPVKKEALIKYKDSI